jgi:hypothetical protein
MLDRNPAKALIDQSGPSDSPDDPVLIELSKIT